MRRETLSLHEGYRSDPTTKAVSVPIYQTSAFHLGDVGDTSDIFNLKADGFTYTRILNPTTRVFEKRYAKMDGGVDALATASGQAATTISMLNICSAGDNIVSSPYLYGNTWNLFRHTYSRMGIEVRFVKDPRNPEEFRALTDKNTKAYFGEVLSNPTLVPLPVQRIASIGNEYGIPLIVDNTVTTNVAFPLEHGATISIYSATKYIGGHGTTMGGLIVDSGKFNWMKDANRFPLLNDVDPAHNNKKWHEATGLLNDLGESGYLLKARMTLMRDLGACISPFNSFLLIQGLETLPLRMERHCENALLVAEYLKQHHQVEKVVYPKFFEGRDKDVVDETFETGYGAIVYFDLKGGLEAGKKFIQNLDLLYHVANVGDVRSLATHPASTTHTTVPEDKRILEGINNGSVRLCIGIEHIEDILFDIERALSSI